MNKSFFAHKIVEWYAVNQRSLPWRQTNDPYKIWLSEIILQQTRVAQGTPYYLKFILRFPDVFALAKASEQEILRLWQGLGYYTRARNLHRCAKIVVLQHRGQFPERYADLQKLPGIGVYTAAAIASIAFGEPVAALDGNVYRVLSRVFGIAQDTHSREGKDFFTRQANELILKEYPAAFNQAMMEFGATHCLPLNPKCEDCIFKKQCVAYDKGWQDRLPVKTKKPKIKKRYFFYFVIEQNKKRLMRKRRSKDIWQGLYDFYLVETKTRQKPENVFAKDPMLKRLRGKIQQNKISGLYKHILTHQQLMTRFIPVSVKLTKTNQALFEFMKLKFYSRKEIDGLPKPVLVSRYLLESDFS